MAVTGQGTPGERGAAGPGKPGKERLRVHKEAAGQLTLREASQISAGSGPSAYLQPLWEELCYVPDPGLSISPGRVHSSTCRGLGLLAPAPLWLSSQSH